MVPVASQKRSREAEVSRDFDGLNGKGVLRVETLLIVVFRHDDLSIQLADGLELCEAGSSCRLCGFHGRCFQ